jgi:hypothetical protein
MPDHPWNPPPMHEDTDRDSMTQRVATAIALEMLDPRVMLIAPYPRPVHMRAARAAIAAMRAPTEEMLIMGQDDEVSERSMLERWQRMIDEALK